MNRIDCRDIIGLTGVSFHSANGDVQAGNITGGDISNIFFPKLYNVDITSNTGLEILNYIFKIIIMELMHSKFSTNIFVPSPPKKKTLAIKINMKDFVFCFCSEKLFI